MRTNPPASARGDGMSRLHRRVAASCRLSACAFSVLCFFAGGGTQLARGLRQRPLMHRPLLGSLQCASVRLARNKRKTNRG